MKREAVTAHVRHYVIYDRDQRLPDAQVKFFSATCRHNNR